MKFNLNKNICLFFAFCIISFTLSNFFSYGQNVPNGIDPKQKVNELNNKAFELQNNYYFDSSIKLCNEAIKIEDNTVSNFILCRIYSRQNNWDEALKYGQKSVKLDTSFKYIYPDLFNVYFQKRKYSDAQNIAEKVTALDNSPAMAKQVANLETAIKINTISNVFCVLLLFSIAFIFLLPIYNAYKNKNSVLQSENKIRFTETILMSSMVCCFLYLVFFILSKWIWSFNPHIQPADYTPFIRAYIFEHDGMESFALYALMLLSIIITSILVPMLLKLKANNKNYLYVGIVLVIIACFYFFKIGFLPPIPDDNLGLFPVLQNEGIENNFQNPLIVIELTLLSIGLYYLYLKRPLFAKIAVIIIICFAGLLTTYPTSLYDLSFIVDPAMRLMQGCKVTEIYFQYDLLLSLIAMAWMKMNFAIEWLPYISQIMFFVFFITSFFFANKYFQSKGLSVLFLIALILMRYYSVNEEGVNIFNVSPLRLDLWLILVVLAYRNGVYHWSVGLTLGLLIILHRNLGILYLGAYLQVLFTLFLLDIIPIIKQKKLDIKTSMLKHFKLAAINLAILIVSVGFCIFFFHGLVSDAVKQYRTLGIGLLPISSVSFYWYVPVLVNTLFILLVYFKQQFAEKYATTAFFVLFLLIANSMYFFGRSHENNILNISGILVFVLFILLDIILFKTQIATKNNLENSTIKDKNSNSKAVKGKPTTETVKEKRVFSLNTRAIAIMLPFLFIFLCSFFYGGRINQKIEKQLYNLSNAQYVYPLLPVPVDTVAIKKITTNSPKVYFLEFYNDFIYYYYGSYKLEGYYMPTGAYIYKNELTKFLQNLLDNHYYIVYNQDAIGGIQKEYLPELNYNKTQQVNKMISISKEDIKLLLPVSTTDVLHCGFVDSVANAGSEKAPVNLNEDFTLEIIAKPTTNQQPYAVLLSNLFNNNNAYKGFSIQMDANNQGRYSFVVSKNDSLLHADFILEANTWNYITIVSNKNNIKVFNNGKLYSALDKSTVISNSTMPIIIGNSSNKKCHFSGLIKEVKISNNTIDEAEIIKNRESIRAELK